MFCPNCGAQIPDGSAFCGTCGAPLGAAGSGTERVLTQDPSLPEGIFRDDSGAYHWVYHLDMKRNPVPLLMLLKIFACVCGGMAAVIFFLLLLNHNTVAAAFRGFAIVAFGIGGFLLLVTWLAWLIILGIHGSNYTVEHLMTEDRVVHLQTHEEREQGRKVKTAAFVLGMFSNDPGAMGLATGAREEMTSRYADVKKLVSAPKHDLIKVNNALQHNHIYAYPHQYAFVWDYLTSHCSGAKTKP